MNLNQAQKLLIVVDEVKGFITTGSMADNFIEHIIPESKRLVETFCENDNPVIFVKDCHEKSSVEFNRFPEHCIKGSKEAEMVDELIKFESKVIVIEKNSTSAMAVKSFIQIIDKMNDLKEVVIIGCCTDICVLNLAIPLQNYFDEENKKVRIVLPKNAVETYDAPNHPRDEYNHIAFKLLAQGGIELIDTY